MPNDPQGQTRVEEKQPASMPEADKTQNGAVVEDGLPEDASDRTKEQFEKLKQSNKELAERLRQLETQPQANQVSVLDALKPQEPVTPILPGVPQFPGFNPKQSADASEQLIDKEGYIDEKVLKGTLKNLQEQVKAAQEEAKRARLETEKIQESAQVRAAHKEFPILDPLHKDFDRNFYEAVKNNVVGQMLNGEKDLLKAAREVSKWYKIPEKQAPSQSKEEQVRQIAATPTSTSRSSQSYSISNEADLVSQTRKGSREALLERLKRAGL